MYLPWPSWNCTRSVLWGKPFSWQQRERWNKRKAKQNFHWTNMGAVLQYLMRGDKSCWEKHCNLLKSLLILMKTDWRKLQEMQQCLSAEWQHCKARKFFQAPASILILHGRLKLPPQIEVSVVFGREKRAMCVWDGFWNSQLSTKYHNIWTWPADCFACCFLLHSIQSTNIAKNGLVWRVEMLSWFLQQCLNAKHDSTDQLHSWADCFPRDACCFWVIKLSVKAKTAEVVLNASVNDPQNLDVSIRTRRRASAPCPVLLLLEAGMWLCFDEGISCWQKPFLFKSSAITASSCLWRWSLYYV